MPLIQLCSVVSISFVQLENVCCWQLCKRVCYSEWLKWRGGEGHKELMSGTGVQHFNSCVLINKSRILAYRGKSLLCYKWCGLTVVVFSSAIICLKKPIYKWGGDCKMNPWKQFFFSREEAIDKPVLQKEWTMNRIICHKITHCKVKLWPCTDEAKEALGRQ